MMMTWAIFWALIGTLGGKADEDGCNRLAVELSARPVLDIRGFAERTIRGFVPSGSREVRHSAGR